MDWLVWDGLGRTSAGGKLELVQAGFGLVFWGVAGLLTSVLREGLGDEGVLGWLR